MSNSVKTLLFVVVAVGLLGLSLISAPRMQDPEAFQDAGEEFFPEFTEPSQATTLEVIEYDSETAELRPFMVQLKDGRWTIPSHHDYPADAKDRMAKAAGLLVGLIKEDVRSDSVEAHEEFGVLDPRDQKLAPGGSGKLVTFKSASGGELASLIVGKAIEGKESLRYVRVPKKKRTYVAKLPGEVSTNFEDWIETDLLKATTADLSKLLWENYSIDEATRSRVDGERNEAVKVANQWVLTELAPERELDTTAINEVATTLGQLKIVGVRAKPAGLSEQMSKTEGITLNRQDLISLQRRGFYVAQGGELFSNEGDLHVSTKKGIAYVLRFGEILFGAGEEVTAGGEKEGEEDLNQEGGEGMTANRFLMVTVGFNESLLKRPTGADLAEVELEQRAETRREIEQIKSAVEKYRSSNESLPADLAALTVGDAPALAELPRDPWDREYVYTAQPEGDFRIVSLGGDGAEGGVDANADIASDNLPFEDQLATAAEEWSSFRDRVEEGKKLAADLRARFAPWYYVIDDESFRKLRRDRHELTKAKEATPSTPPAPGLGQPAGG